MSIQTATPTGDETLAAIVEKAKTSGDRFIIKVSRRKGFSGMLEHIATLGDATVQHAAAPETWLPQLCGGGEYGLAVYHHEAPTQRVGNYLHLSLRGQVQEVSGQAVRSRAWEGPTTLIFPQIFPEIVEGMKTPVTPLFAGATVNGQGQQVSPDMYAYMQRIEERMRTEAATREREVAEREARLRREIDTREEQLRREQLESKLRHEFESRQRELEVKLAGTPKEDSTVKLLAVLAPVMVQFFQQQHETRLAGMKREQEAAAQQLTVLRELTARPTGMTPEMQMLIETLRAQSNGGGVYADMMTRMVDAMGAVSKTSVSMINAIADLNLGGGNQEHPVLSAVKEGIKAMSALSSGAESGARRMVAQARQPPPMPRQSLPPTPYQQHAAAHQQHVAAQQAQGAAQPPAQAVPPPPVQPETQQPQGFADYAPPSVMDRLKALIMNKHEPVADVATYFFDSLTTDELKQELEAVDDDVQMLVAKHLGTWVLDAGNGEYLERLGEALQDEGIRRGVVPDEDEEGDDADDDEDAS